MGREARGKVIDYWHQCLLPSFSGLQESHTVCFIHRFGPVDAGGSFSKKMKMSDEVSS